MTGTRSDGPSSPASAETGADRWARLGRLIGGGSFEEALTVFDGIGGSYLEGVMSHLPAIDVVATAAVVESVRRGAPAPEWTVAPCPLPEPTDPSFEEDLVWFVRTLGADDLDRAHGTAHDLPFDPPLSGLREVADLQTITELAVRMGSGVEDVTFDPVPEDGVGGTLAGLYSFVDELSDGRAKRVLREALAASDDGFVRGVVRVLNRASGYDPTKDVPCTFVAGLPSEDWAAVVEGRENRARRDRMAARHVRPTGTGPSPV